MAYCHARYNLHGFFTVAPISESEVLEANKILNPKLSTEADGIPGFTVKVRDQLHISS